MKTPLRPVRIPRAVLGLMALALIWRGVFLFVSHGSYTDGILQIDSFRQGLTYWPPLFAALVRIFSWVPGLGLEGSGRMIAWLAGALAIWPLYSLATQLFGRRAAFWAAVAWIASPDAMRWSVQPMTDMPMTALWTLSLAALVLGIKQLIPGMFPQDAPAGGAAPSLSGTPPAPQPEPNAAIKSFWLASIAGALATLTRYQGILLLAPIALAVLLLTPLVMNLARRHPVTAMKLWLTLLPWLIVPAWLLHGGAASLLNHFHQISQRAASPGALQTLLNYWYEFEEFVMRSPYFFTYGIFGFMLYGLFRTQWATARLRWLGWLALVFTLLLLAIQSVFLSFQSRYLMPLLPFVCLFAGHGLATWERHTDRRFVLFSLLAIPALAYALFFSTLVAVDQGNPFEDLKQAGQFLVAKYPDLSTRHIYSNETFNAEIGAAKLSFWTGGHAVDPLFQANARGEPQTAALKAGDLIVLVSAYGGFSRYMQVRRLLIAQTNGKVIGYFARNALPLLPDIMEEPDSHQNPTALDQRYHWQQFETTVLEIQGIGAAPGRLPGGAPAINPAVNPAIEHPPILQPTPDAKRLEELRRLQNQMNDLRSTSGTQR